MLCSKTQLAPREARDSSLGPGTLPAANEPVGNKGPEIVKNFGLGTCGPIRRPKTPLFRRGRECYKA